MPIESKTTLRAPYRVAVWGPGQMGQAAIREILRLPETELVAVLGYNPENDGADVSKLIGGPPTGVKITTSMDQMAQARPDVVLHTCRFFGDFRADDEILRALEMGLNVISVQPYMYPAARGADVQKKFEDACKRGGSTLHGSGVDPGFLYERMAALATGITNDVQYIKLKEFLSLQDHYPEILHQMGFGTTLDEMANNKVASVYAGHYLTMAIHYLANKLGMPLDRIEPTVEVIPAPNAITTAKGLTAEKGTVAYLVHTWTGFVKERPFFIIELHWYLDDLVKPAEALHPYYYTVEIEGIPSIRLGLEITGSYVLNAPLNPRNPTPGDYMATVVSIIQAIPAVVDGPPGLLEVEMPQFHWKPDMRL